MVAGAAFAALVDLPCRRAFFPHCSVLLLFDHFTALAAIALTRWVVLTRLGQVFCSKGNIALAWTR